jgi:DNA polymerase-3 subunit gamma/tau
VSDLVLARKYRPRTFAQMVGQEHVVQALANALAQKRLHHAYLFTGTRGIGKTTVSRILAKSLNCIGPDGRGDVTPTPCGICDVCRDVDADRFVDYIELDAASHRGIDDARDLIERAAYKPGVGRYKVFMIDEAHQLTKEAFNALLKTLEEPPAYLKFVLATTDPEKVLPTVLSRCLQFNLRPMAPPVIARHLATVLAAEGMPHEEAALRLIARAARGSMRDALSLTDQALAFGAGQVQEASVRSMLGTLDRHHPRAIVEALAARDAVALLAAVEGLRQLALPAEGALEAVATLLQQMAVEQAVPGALDTNDPDLDDARALAPRLAADETQLAYGIALQGRSELPLLGDEYGALTMVLLRFLAFPPEGAAPAAPAPPAARPAAAPLRAPAPATIAVPVPVPVPVPAAPSVPAAIVMPPASPAPPAPPPPAAPTASTDPTLGDRWQRTVRRLVAEAGLSGLARELAMQSGLEAIDDTASPPAWRLVAESDSLRGAAQIDKLAAALGALLGAPQRVQVEAGVPADSPARREAAAREAAQREAERSIREDPYVAGLLRDFPGARIVPGSIRPRAPATDPEPRTSP